MNIQVRNIVFLGAAVSALGLWAGGCSEKDVPFVSDINHMMQFLDRTEAGQDLFRWDSLIIPADYTLPFTTAVFRDSVVGHTRSNQFDSIRYEEFGVPVGNQPACNFKISDTYDVRTRKIDGVDTTYVDDRRTIVRSGKFVKLGSDFEDFLGWSLWSFAGRDLLSPVAPTIQVTTTFQPIGQSAVAVNQDRLVRLTESRTIASGTNVILKTISNTADSLREPAVILSAEDISGFVQRSMIRVDRDHYLDTLKTPANNKRLWNLILVQTFHDTEFFFTGGFIIPYRVPQ